MLTRDQVIEIVGQIDDWKIVEILALKPTAEELLEARTGAVEQGDLEAETGRRMSGTVARLYDILMADEPQWPEGDEPA